MSNMCEMLVRKCGHSEPFKYSSREPGVAARKKKFLKNPCIECQEVVRANRIEADEEGVRRRVLDQFAAAALTGILAAHAEEGMQFPTDEIAAKMAFEYADAMLAEREKRAASPGGDAGAELTGTS